jgi:hypothetical protein
MRSPPAEERQTKPQLRDVQSGLLWFNFARLVLESVEEKVPFQSDRGFVKCTGEMMEHDNSTGNLHGQRGSHFEIWLSLCRLV